MDQKSYLDGVIEVYLLFFGNYMDFKICERCPCNHSFYEVVFLKYGGQVILVSKADEKTACRLASENEALIDLCVDHILTFSDDLIPFSTLLAYKDIQPTRETCPFYLEHQMNEWNKKK